MKAKSLLLAAVISMGAAVSAGAQSVEKRFHLDGKVVSIRPASKTAVIDAKAIPGFMSAMAMPYAFKDSVELSKLKAGDHITADVVVAGGRTWVEKIVMVKDSTAAKKP